jgi:hypothetical protein
MAEEIVPDTKDWTWVLDRPCPDCGFDASRVVPEQLPEIIHANTRGWYDALDGAEVSARPRPDVWSPLEYACHVRDVHLLFAERIELMLAEDDPRFANWDQDETAVALRYGEQAVDEVLEELVEAAAAVAGVYAQVAGDQWDRPGRRSNGDAFTVASLGRYHLHDVVHHLWDVA